MEKANERAQVIEYNNLNLAEFESPEAAKDRVQEFVRLEYNYGDSTGDSVQGLGIPNTDDHEFPDDLKTFYVSNSSYAQRAINVRPLNTVDAFLAYHSGLSSMDQGLTIIWSIWFSCRRCFGYFTKMALS